MKRVFFRFFLCFFLQHSLLIACGDEGPCKYRKYGHRRAFLQRPIISPGGTLPAYSYEEYFKGISRAAMQLRMHLIKTGAFVSEDKEARLTRTIALAYLEMPTSSAPTIEEIAKPIIDQYITSEQQTQVLWITKAKKHKLGDQNIKNLVLQALQKPQAELVGDAAILQKVGEEIKKIKQEVEAEKAKSTLEVMQRVNGRVIPLIKNIREEFDKKDRNIASFGFVFFDQEGKRINECPFHFSPDATEATLEEPFFFLSGRRHRPDRKVDEDAGQRDPYRWTGLPETAPKKEDLRLISPKIFSDPAPLAIDETFAHVLPGFAWRNLQRLQDLFENISGEYNDSMREALVVKAQQEPFFNYVYSRTLGSESRVVKKEVCKDLLNLLNLPTSQVQLISKGKSLTGTPTMHYPVEKAANTNETEEKHFTHSEQYALFKAHSTLEKFLDSCIARLRILLQPAVRPAGVGPEGREEQSMRTVRSYAVLPYTYNIMCVRCAQSLIIEFAHSAEGFNQIINRKLDFLSPDNTRPMVFMAGYTRPYTSELHNHPADLFEHWAERVLSPQAPRVPNLENFMIGYTKAYKSALRDNPFETVRRRELISIDLTLGEREGYDNCSPEDIPEMIYHVKIPEQRA